MIDSGSEDDTFMEHERVHDDRFCTLKADSSYIALDDIDGSLETFMKSQYVALHLNIHSLASKYTELRNMLSKFKENGITIHFVLLCETFLNSANADMYNIPGYNFVYLNRTTMSRRGVSIDIISSLTYIERPDISVNVEGEFESITIEVKTRTRQRNVIVAEIYRVPNTNELSSIERYNDMLTTMSNTSCDVIIGTDQNFDYKKVDQQKKNS